MQMFGWFLMTLLTHVGYFAYLAKL